MTKKTKATLTYKGYNGVNGFLTGEKYHVLLSRIGSDTLVIEREPGKNFHSVSSSLALVQPEQEFLNSWELPVDTEIDYSKLPEYQKEQEQQTIEEREDFLKSSKKDTKKKGGEANETEASEGKKEN